MKTTKKILKERISKFNQVCRDAGVKLTHQRLEIYKEIAQSEDHPDAEMLYQRIRNRLPSISLDTVYRTLWLLQELGLVEVLDSSKKRSRFDANLEQHHHFVCLTCGLTRDFYCEALNDLKLPKEVKSFGKIQRTNIEVRGICLNCEEKNHANDNK